MRISECICEYVPVCMFLCVCVLHMMSECIWVFVRVCVCVSVCVCVYLSVALTPHQHDAHAANEEIEGVYDEREEDVVLGHLQIRLVRERTSQNHRPCEKKHTRIYTRTQNTQFENINETWTTHRSTLVLTHTHTHASHTWIPPTTHTRMHIHTYQDPYTKTRMQIRTHTHAHTYTHKHTDDFRGDTLEYIGHGPGTVTDIVTHCACVCVRASISVCTCACGVCVYA
jgi:hypothetical protein